MRVAPAALLAAALAFAAPLQQLTPLDEAVYRKVVASHKGNILLVDLWATWCSPCIEELPQILRLERKYHALGFRLVTISCDEPREEAGALELLRKHGAPAPAYVKRVRNDESFINWLDKQWSGALPALFLYGRDGRQIQSFVGETDMDALEKAVLKALDRAAR